MIVTKDEIVFESLNAGRVPLVYVHRRTSTKRIFPSLYDMFVGGVSTRGEQSRLTAAREVAEELGLTRGLDILNGRIAVEKNYSPRRIIPVYCVHILQSMCRVNVYVHVV